MHKKKLLSVLASILLILSNSQAQSPEDIDRVVLELSADLRENYVFEDKANLMADGIIENLNSGDYYTLESFEALANALHKDLRNIVPDKHLRIRYGSPRPPSDPDPTREYFPNGIAESKLLDGNIGYFDLRGFSSPSKSLKDAAAEAMQKLEEASSIIIDMRQNGGGSPGGVQLFCSYFFPESPEILLNSLYFRNRDEKTDFYTMKNVDGPRFVDTPLYILTSAYTFSGGEEFCYNMQTQKRATLIGETTGGGAHPVNSYSLPNNIRAIIPIGRAINPVTGTNWEAVGVKPDVEVDADLALETALEMIK